VLVNVANNTDQPLSERILKTACRSTAHAALLAGESGLNRPVALDAVGNSSLDGLPSWIADARSLKGAQANCSATPLTGGEITVTQYVSGSFDYDYSCK
jgi:hypothetical protein